MARGYSTDFSLTHILEDIYAARIPGPEQRYLAKHAVGTAMGITNRGNGYGGGGESSTNHIDLVEASLSMVGGIAGFPHKPTITQAKEALRVRGHSLLASRLGKATKKRNAQAHPDFELVHRLALLKDEVSPAAGSTPTSMSDEELQDSKHKEAAEQQASEK